MDYPLEYERPFWPFSGQALRSLTMDFFEHQAKANRSSKYLILGYLVALVIITLGFNLAGMIVWAVATEPLALGQATQELNLSHLLPLWLDSRYSWQVTVAVILFVGTVSLANWFSLRQGGDQVAKMMGGRRIPANTMNKDEKRLLNVVEEMALAAGMPVPDVFIMDQEHAINAFAAGYAPNEAAICVTRGLIISLNRDELQGVIGHEFSHILNGDMRLNVRIISVLSGLVAMGQLGRWLTELGFRSSHDTRGGVFFLILPGLLIWLIGSLGVLCSRVIKAALSRQREFLADASAVQFTRQTQGIASALHKIHHHRYQSLLKNRHAEDLSHMCIAKTLNMRFTSLLDTHPPIEERIRRLDAQFLTKTKIQAAQTRLQEQSQTDGSVTTGTANNTERLSAGSSSATTSPLPTETLSSNFSDSETSTLPPSDALYGTELQQEEMIEFTSPMQQANVDQAVASIGLTDDQRIEAARACLSSMPQDLLMSLRQPDYAPLVLLLMLAQTNTQPNIAIKILEKHQKYPQSLLEHYLPIVSEMQNRPIYPVLQLAMAAVKSCTKEDKQDLLRTAKQIIASDNSVQPQELFFYLVLFRHLNPKAKRNPAIEISSISQLKKELATLFAFLCQFTDEEHKDAAFQKAIQQFHITGVTLPDYQRISHQALGNAIFRIEHLAPMLKRSVVLAVTDLMQHDDTITHQEFDWLRMLADCWDCPIPLSVSVTTPA